MAGHAAHPTNVTSGLTSASSRPRWAVLPRAVGADYICRGSISPVVERAWARRQEWVPVAVQPERDRLRSVREHLDEAGAQADEGAGAEGA